MLFAQKVKKEGTTGKKKRRSSVKSKRRGSIGKGGERGGGIESYDGPQFIEGKRSHNLCIGLAQFKKYHSDFDVLVRAVLQRKLTPHALSTLSELLPTKVRARLFARFCLFSPDDFN